MKIHVAALLAFAFTLACTAAPLNPVEDKKKSPPKNKPATVLFFYDSKCTEPANTIQIFPAAQQTGGFGNDQYYGGDYGSRSALFSDIGDLQVWYIQSATNGPNGDAPNENTMNPKAGQCVGYDDGVYAAGS